MPWKVTVAKPALRALSRTQDSERRRIQAALASIEIAPFSGDLKHLSNDPRGAYRRRVGSWRIFFDVDTQDGFVYVTAIERRTSTTY